MNKEIKFQENGGRGAAAEEDGYPTASLEEKLMLTQPHLVRTKSYSPSPRSLPHKFLGWRGAHNFPMSSTIGCNKNDLERSFLVYLYKLWQMKASRPHDWLSMFMKLFKCHHQTPRLTKHLKRLMEHMWERQSDFSISDQIQSFEEKAGVNEDMLVGQLHVNRMLT